MGGTNNQRRASRWVHSNDLWVVVANVGYALSQWLVVAILARQSSAATLGEYTLALALSAPIFMCANMRLRFLQATDNRFALVHYASVRGMSTALAAAITFGVAWLSELERPLLFVVLGVIAVKAVESMQDIVVGHYQSRSQMSAVARSLLLSAVLGTLLFAVTFDTTQSLVLSCLAMALVRVVALTLVDMPIVRRHYAAAVSSDSKTLAPPEGSALARCRLLLTIAWPLGIVAMLDSLNTNVPRYLLAALAGTSEVGQYSAMAYFAFAGFLVANSLCQSRISLLARAVSAGESREAKRALQSMFSGIVAIGLCGVAAAAIGGDFILGALYGTGFVTSDDSAFLHIMIGGALTYVALGLVYALTAYGETRLQVLLYASNAVTVTGVGAVLVPAWGVQGAAVALTTANLVQIILGVVAIRRCFGRKASKGLRPS